MTQLWLALTLQEADLRRKAKRQEEMQDEYAKIKNRLKNLDIELHTEARASLCYCQELKLWQVVQLVHVSAVAYDWLTASV